MITTIFTGHTLDLGDILAIGPVMCSQNEASIEIYLHGGTCIQHKKSFYAETFEAENKALVAHAKELVALRDELVTAWKQQLYDMSYTQDDRPTYQGAEASYTMGEVRRRLAHAITADNDEAERRIGGAFSNEIVRPIIENWHE